MQPLNPSANPAGTNRGPHLSAGFVVVSAVLLALAMVIVGVTGYFRLGSETTALRQCLMRSVPGAAWNKKIAVHVGWFTTTLVRNGSRFFNIPPEPRAALDALQGAEVGVYELQENPAFVDAPAIFKAADTAMKSRGWDRIVGVAQEHQLVAVYFPHGTVSLRGVKCCVLVLSGRNLVVGSVRGNLEPLLKLADAHLDLSDIRRHLPSGI